MTDARKYLKAAEGRVVRREDNGAIWPEAGDWVADSLFIRRRLADGDLVVASPPVEPELATPPEPPATDDAAAKPPKPSKAEK